MFLRGMYLPGKIDKFKFNLFLDHRPSLTESTFKTITSFDKIVADEDSFFKEVNGYVNEIERMYFANGKFKRFINSYKDENLRIGYKDQDDIENKREFREKDFKTRLARYRLLYLFLTAFRNFSSNNYKDTAVEVNLIKQKYKAAAALNLFKYELGPKFVTFYAEESWDKELIVSIEDWLRICLDDAYSEWFGKGELKSRAAEIEDFLNDIQKIKELKVKYETKKDKNLIKQYWDNYLVQVLYSWYLKNYNLSGARKVIENVVTGSGNTRQDDNKKYGLWRRELLTLGNKISSLSLKKLLFWRLDMKRQVMFVLLLLIPSFTAYSIWQQQVAINGLFNFSAVIVAMYYLVIPSLFTLGVKIRHYWICLLLPRLTCGIIVGYLFLVFSGPYWKVLSLDISNGVYVGISLFAVMVSAAYLYHEIAGNVHEATFSYYQDARKIWYETCRRVLTVLLIGLTEAIVIGILIFFTGWMFIKAGIPGFGAQFISREEWAAYGITRFVLVSGPLALLLGTFTQIIWQEKQISNPM